MDAPPTSPVSSGAFPMVSIVIPCLNERDLVGKCLDSIAANDYPKERVEVLVVDGESTDGTRAMLEEYRHRYPYIHVLTNEKKDQPIALNIGITRARGAIIMRMDAHSAYREDYISQCVRALQETGADNVGGKWITIPRQPHLIGKAIAFAMTLPLGVGNARYRLTPAGLFGLVKDEPCWDVHVGYFCCRREIFDTIGLFNEKLYASEDIDFRARLREGGFRTLYLPTIVSYYFMRSDLRSFLKHMFRNGLWVVLPLNYSRYRSFSIRHIIPLGFVLGLFLGGLLALSSPAVRFVWLGLLGLYGVLNLVVAGHVASREKDIRYVVAMPLVFTLFHVTYGAGSLVGLIRLALLRLRPRAAP